VGPIDAAPVSDASLLSANFLPPDRKTLYLWSNPVKDTRRLWAYKDDTQKLTLIGESKRGGGFYRRDTETQRETPLCYFF
jgi:hypothetical protein